MFDTFFAGARGAGFNRSRRHVRSIEERLGILFFAAALIFSAAHGLFAHEFQAGDLRIVHPWARAAPAGAPVAGGYVVIENGSSGPDRLVSVSADIAGRVEIHEMAVTDGVMTMRPLADGIEIPANGKVELKPGSYHLMFMDLNGKVEEGARFAGTLTFEKAGPVAVEFVVEAAAPAQDHSSGHGSTGRDH